MTEEKIFLPKWTELLIALYHTPAEHCYCGRLHREVGMTTRHLRNLITQLETKNIVTRQNGGKIKYITLTETGTRLAKLFLEIYPRI